MPLANRVCHDLGGPTLDGSWPAEVGVYIGPARPEYTTGRCCCPSRRRARADRPAARVAPLCTIGPAVILAPKPIPHGPLIIPVWLGARRSYNVIPATVARPVIATDGTFSNRRETIGADLLQRAVLVSF